MSEERPVTEAVDVRMIAEDEAGAGIVIMFRQVKIATVVSPVDALTIATALVAQVVALNTDGDMVDELHDVLEGLLKVWT